MPQGRRGHQKSRGPIRPSGSIDWRSRRLVDLRRARISRIRGANGRTRPQPGGSGAGEADACHLGSDLRLWDLSRMAGSCGRRKSYTHRQTCAGTLLKLAASVSACSPAAFVQQVRAVDFVDTARMRRADTLALLRAGSLDPELAALIWLMSAGDVPLLVAGSSSLADRSSVATALLSLGGGREWVVLDADAEPVTPERLSARLARRRRARRNHRRR